MKCGITSLERNDRLGLATDLLKTGFCTETYFVVYERKNFGRLSKKMDRPIDILMASKNRTLN
jgi:hypothetical protein